MDDNYIVKDEHTEKGTLILNERDKELELKSDSPDQGGMLYLATVLNKNGTHTFSLPGDDNSEEDNDNRNKEGEDTENTKHGDEFKEERNEVNPTFIQSINYKNADKIKFVNLGFNQFIIDDMGEIRTTRLAKLVTGVAR